MTSMRQIDSSDVSNESEVVYHNSQPTAHFEFGVPAGTMKHFRDEIVNLKETVAAAQVPELATVTATPIYEREGRTRDWHIELLARQIRVFPPNGNGYLKTDWELYKNFDNLPSLAMLKEGGNALLEELQFHMSVDDGILGALDGQLGVFVYRSTECLTGAPEDEDKMFAESPADICERLRQILDTGILQEKYPRVRFGASLYSDFPVKDERSLMAFVPLDYLREIGIAEVTEEYPENEWMENFWRAISPKLEYFGISPDNAEDDDF